MKITFNRSIIVLDFIIVSYFTIKFHVFHIKERKYKFISALIGLLKIIVFTFYKIKR